MNLNKVIPKTINQCKCLCCSDCAYYDKDISWTNCEQRNKLIREQYNKKGVLGV